MCMHSLSVSTVAPFAFAIYRRHGRGEMYIHSLSIDNVALFAFLADLAFGHWQPMSSESIIIVIVVILCCLCTVVLVTWLSTVS